MDHVAVTCDAEPGARDSGAGHVAHELLAQFAVAAGDADVRVQGEAEVACRSPVDDAGLRFARVAEADGRASALGAECVATLARGGRERGEGVVVVGGS